MTEKQSNLEQTKELRNCGDCLYWKKDDGTCHKYAPRPTYDIPVKNIQWPATNEDDFCGEFKSKKNSPAYMVELLNS